MAKPAKEMGLELSGAVRLRSFAATAGQPPRGLVDGTRAVWRGPPSQLRCYGGTTFAWLGGRDSTGLEPE
jgi:hypothetical protein